MSCYVCGYNPCCCDPCVTTTTTACIGEDPGMETQLKYIGGYDNQFRARRLQNAAGVLTASLDGSGNYTLGFTNAPAIAYSTFAVGLNTPFSGILAALGANSVTMKVAPNAEGFLRGNADGTFTLVTLPAATVPDPLTVTNLFATTFTVDDLTTNGVVMFNNLLDDTIVSVLGLNAAGELVTTNAGTSGGVGGVSIAKYLETPAEPSLNPSPNQLKTNGDQLIVGNEVFDPDSIASVLDTERIRIDKAGTYRVDWGLNITPYFRVGSTGWPDPIPQPFFHQALLRKNGAAVSYGNQFKLYADHKTGGTLTGSYMDTFAVADTLAIWFLSNNGGISGTKKSGIEQVNLCLTKVG